MYTAVQFAIVHDPSMPVPDPVTMTLPDSVILAVHHITAVSRVTDEVTIVRVVDGSVWTVQGDVVSVARQIWQVDEPF